MGRVGPVWCYLEDIFRLRVKLHLRYPVILSIEHKDFNLNLKTRAAGVESQLQCIHWCSGNTNLLSIALTSMSRALTTL